MSKKTSRRRLGLHTRTNAPIVVYVAADPAVEDLNTPEAIEAYKKYEGPITVDDDCARFTIRALSHQEKQDIEEDVQMRFPDVISEGMARSKKAEEEAKARGDDEVAPDFSVEEEDVKFLIRSKRLAQEQAMLRVQKGLIGISIPSETLEEPPEGWWKWLDPHADVGLGDPATCQAMIAELGDMIDEVSRLGPKAEPFFKRLYGSPTEALVDPPAHPGDATDAQPSPESGEAPAEAPSNQG